MLNLSLALSREPTFAYAMLRMGRLCLLLIIGAWGSVVAQTTRIYGWVKDPQGKGIEGVHVQWVGAVQGTVSLAGGYYELKVRLDTPVMLRFSYAGVVRKEVRLNPEGHIHRLDVVLPVTIQLQEVTVTGTAQRQRTGLRLSPSLIGRLATPMKSVEAVLETLPGVSGASELSSAYSVRGGNYDENLVFINGIETYRPQVIRSSQQEGLSVINPYLVKDIYFSRGGFEAQYGDKLSSVLDITYREPDSLEGQASISLLEANVSLGWHRERWFQLLAARYRTTRYLLGTLDTRGEYQPRFGDLQHVLTYRASSRSDLQLFNYATINRYLLLPQSRRTEFGLPNLVLQLNMFMSGSDIAGYRHHQHALRWNYRPRPSLHWNSTAFYFGGYEVEKMDIIGAYLLSEIDKDPESETRDQPVATIGAGAYLQHIRNALWREQWGARSDLTWRVSEAIRCQIGMRTYYETVQDRLHEWRLDDSSDFSIPLSRGDSLKVAYFLHSEINLRRWVAQAYLQGQWVVSEADGFYLTGGMRTIWWQHAINGPYVMPRFQLIYHLNRRHNRQVLMHQRGAPLKRIYTLRLSGGYYVQIPSYREMRDRFGQLHLDLLPQTAWHLIGGIATHISIWGRPFRLSSEIFYKWLRNVNIYDLEDIRIRYYATDNAEGRVGGIEFHLNGEFVPRIPSWVSLTIMDAREKVPGDPRGWIPRPTDQRVMAAIFFQDFLPSDPRHQVNLQVVFGSGLPFGPPQFIGLRNSARMKPYQRVNIGIARSLTRSGWLPMAWRRRVQDVWLRINVFNVFGHKNILSYFWARDINGNYWGVPNYMTRRLLNVEFSVSF